MALSMYDEHGREILDQTPISISVPFQTDRDRIREMIRREISQHAQDTGMETFEEANDFEVDNDDSYDPSSPWEEQFDPETGRSSFDVLRPEAATQQQETEGAPETSQQQNGAPKTVQPVSG